MDVTLSLSKGDYGIEIRITLRQAQGDIEFFCESMYNYRNFKQLTEILSNLPKF